jgi:hypothetical protein
MRTTQSIVILGGLVFTLAARADDSGDCCPPGSASVVCKCPTNNFCPDGSQGCGTEPLPPAPPAPPPAKKISCDADWSYEINPESTDQYACKANGKVVAPFKSCNDDNLCENHDGIVAECRARCEAGEFGEIPPAAPHAPVAAHLDVALAVSTRHSCTRKVDVVRSAATSLSGSGATGAITDAAAYCAKLFPLGDQQVLELYPELSAAFTFSDIDDCITKVAATVAEATAVRAVTAAGSLAPVTNATGYCQGLFPNQSASDPPPANAVCKMSMPGKILYVGCSYQIREPELYRSAQPTEAACLDFCAQHGTGYCDFIKTADGTCTWMAVRTRCGAWMQAPLAASNSGICGNAPVPGPYRQ